MDLTRGATPIAFLYVTERDRALRFYLETLGLEVEPGSADDYGDYIELGGARLIDRSNLHPYELKTTL
jgi:hypothetical protein